MASQRVIGYILILVVFVVAVFWGTDAMAGGKDAVKSFLRMGPNVTVGMETTDAAEAKVPAEHEAAIKDLVQTMKSMLGGGKVNCFEQYKGLPNLREHGTRLIFTEGRVEIFNEERTVIELEKELKEELKGFKPCAIAGKSGDSDVADNFYYKFLVEDESEVVGEYYSAFPRLVIERSDEGFWQWTNTNRINFGQGWEDLENNWLFTPDGIHICFLPTVTSGHDEDGLGVGALNNMQGLERCS